MTSLLFNRCGALAPSVVHPASVHIEVKQSLLYGPRKYLQFNGSARKR